MATLKSISIDRWSISELNNIGHCVTETATRMPDAVAVAAPAKKQKKKIQLGEKLRYDTLTFLELENSSNQLALGFHRMGIGPGTRIALMVPPGLEFVKHVFALFKSGATVILIDPGMGKENMISCLSEADPKGIVGIPKAHLARVLFRRQFPKCKLNVVVGGIFPKCKSAKAFFKLNPNEFDNVNISSKDDAAIIFTTGSTGPPKGVLYQHQIFINQVEQIREYYKILPGNVDVSGFPLFALFNSAMGVTTVFPEMDATRPAEIHPPNLIDAVSQFSATQSFGSPALWNTVSKFCLQNRVKLPSIQTVLTAGAPVAPDILEQTKKIISSDGEIHTPYGATESLPVASNSATTVLEETASKTRNGAGTCVGHRFEGIQWKLIEIHDDPITDISEITEVQPGSVGELIVQGKVVTRRYVTRVSANADHKIADGELIWHRMGDVGYFDDQERFWFCGRKGHRVRTSDGPLFTIPCEGIVNQHPSIYRSALVGIGDVGDQRPIVILEPHREFFPRNESDQKRLISEVREIMSEHWQTNGIQEILIRQQLPVDIRHNSKIFREKLSVWAQQQLN
ncbi:MAG: fatty acid CoA ligase family protein, partial [Planctomycetota bacterium]